MYQTFQKEKSIRKTYNSLKNDPILRADFLRYLILLAEGGVYSDIDTWPIQSIERWIPPEYINLANVVLGIEADKGQGPIWRGSPWTVQISQFTVMSKPHHPLMRQVVEDIQEGIKLFSKQHGPDWTLSHLSFDDVVSLTGPRAFTSAVYHYLADHVGYTGNGDVLSGLKEPVLLADVLILPINAFASGQKHSNSGTSEDKTALVSHNWMSSWVPTHPRQEDGDSD